MLALDCSPIHPRFLERGRFKPCLWPGYFLLRSSCWRPACCWLGWRSTSIGDPVKAIMVGFHKTILIKRVQLITINIFGYILKRHFFSYKYSYLFFVNCLILNFVVFTGDYWRTGLPICSLWHHAWHVWHRRWWLHSLPSGDLWTASHCRWWGDRNRSRSRFHLPG